MNNDFDREFMRRRYGHTAQAGGIRRLEYAEGDAKGVSLLEFNDGAALCSRCCPTVACIESIV